MKRPQLLHTTLAVVVALTACTGAASQSKPPSPSPEEESLEPSPAAFTAPRQLDPDESPDEAWIRAAALARAELSSTGKVRPEVTRLLKGPYAEMEALVFSGAKAAGQERLELEKIRWYFVQVEGDFECDPCTRPAGFEGPNPMGRVIKLLYSAATGELHGGSGP